MMERKCQIGNTTKLSCIEKLGSKGLKRSDERGTNGSWTEKGKSVPNVGNSAGETVPNGTASWNYFQLGLYGENPIIEAGGRAYDYALPYFDFSVEVERVHLVDGLIEPFKEVSTIRLDHDTVVALLPNLDPQLVLDAGLNPLKVASWIIEAGCNCDLVISEIYQYLHGVGGSKPAWSYFGMSPLDVPAYLANSRTVNL